MEVMGIRQQPCLELNIQLTETFSNASPQSTFPRNVSPSPHPNDQLTLHVTRQRSCPSTQIDTKSGPCMRGAWKFPDQGPIRHNTAIFTPWRASFFFFFLLFSSFSLENHLGIHYIDQTVAYQGNFMNELN
jgi:hypothetical protein